MKSNEYDVDLFKPNLWWLVIKPSHVEPSLLSSISITQHELGTTKPCELKRGYGRARATSDPLVKTCSYLPQIFLSNEYNGDDSAPGAGPPWKQNDGVNVVHVADGNNGTVFSVLGKTSHQRNKLMVMVRPLPVGSTSFPEFSEGCHCLYLHPWHHFSPEGISDGMSEH